MRGAPWPVVRVIARWYGVAEPAEPAGEPEGGPASVRECALGWGLRTREIRLGERWWSEDHGPLIGYRERDGTPVALLPGGGGYSMRDPERGSRTRVTGREAGELRSEATMLYRGRVGARLPWFALRGSGRDLGLIAASLAVTAVAAVLGPLLAGLVLGPVAGRGQSTVLFGLGGAVLAFGVLAAAATFVRGVAVLRIEGRAELAVQAAMCGRLLAMPAAEFSRWSTARIGKAVLGVDALVEELVRDGLVLGTAGVGVLGELALLIGVGGWAGLLAPGAVALGLGGCVAALRSQGRAERRGFSAEQRLSALTTRLVTGVAQLRGADAEQRALSRWREVFAEHRAVSARARVRGDGAVGLALAGYALCVPVALGAGLLPAAPAPRITALCALGLLGYALGECAWAMTRMVRVQPKVDDVLRLLRAPAGNPAGRHDPGEPQGGLGLHEVTFRYRPGDAPVLDGVSFEVAAGEFVALAGPSGSGKSTVLRLLLGFEEPERGTVTYDGVDLAERSGESLRHRGVVLQNAPALAGDIGSNITGGGDHTIDDAWAVAARVGLDTTIAAMPMGMRTVLTDGAATLSRAQRQRLALARALLGTPRFLFLDEATSALDERSARLVDRDIAGLPATRLVITDRPSTLRRADRVIVLDRGRVVQQGDYETLLRERDGTFNRLVRAQL